MSNYRNIRTLVKECPYLLESIKDSKLLKVADCMMPKSVGLEIECSLINESDENLVHELISKTEGVIDLYIGTLETSFRVVEGHKGMIAIYKVMEIFKKYYAINPSSGIHYHVSTMLNLDLLEDECGGKIRFSERTKNDLEWVLKSLDSWGYKGKFNERIVTFAKQWVKLHIGYDTIEYRIGEMTFEYTKIIKRILNVQNITIKLENQLTAFLLFKTFINYSWHDKANNLLYVLSSKNKNDKFKNHYIKLLEPVVNKITNAKKSNRNIIWLNLIKELDLIVNDILKNYPNFVKIFGGAHEIDKRSVIYNYLKNPVKSQIKL